MKQSKRPLSLILALAMLLTLLPQFAATKANANGYDNGYAGGMAGSGQICAYGVDLSEWQSGISLASIKAAGIDYVILRCGYTGAKDSCFESFYSQAKAAGLDVGVYFYSYASSVADALSDAQACLSYISGKTFEYPIYYDVEDADSQGGLSTGTLQSMCLTFMDTLADYGYLTGIYSGEYWTTDKLYASSFVGRYEWWVAAYYNDFSPNHVTGYEYTYGMWQYSDRSYVAGWSIDANVCYKDYPTIVKTYGFNGYGAAGGGAAAATVIDGVFTISTPLDTGYVIGVAGNSDTSGANIELQKRDYDNDYQKFVITRDLESGNYVIRNLGSGHYLDDAGASTTDGANVQQCMYTGVTAQQWKLLENSDGTYTLKNVCANLVMDLTGSKVQEGTNIELWSYALESNLVWNLERVPELTDGVYRLSSGKDSGYVMQTAGNSMEDFGNVQLANRSEGQADQWVVRARLDGFYTIRALHSEKYLDVSEGSSQAGANVQQYSYNGNASQLWSAVPNTDGTWSFASACGDLYLDVDGDTVSSGKNLQLGDGDGTAVQRWNMEAQRTIAEGVYHIGSSENTQQLLNVANASGEGGANIQCDQGKNTAESKVVIEYVDNGFYTLRMLNSDLYLDVSGNNRLPGSNVIQHTYTGARNQLWRILPLEDGTYELQSPCGNLCLDRYNGYDADGTNILAWKPNQGKGQFWRLTAANIESDGVWTVECNGSVLTDSGNTMSLQTAAGGKNQQFILQFVNGSYTFRSYSDFQSVCSVPWNIVPHTDGTCSFVHAQTGAYLSEDLQLVEKSEGAKWTLRNRSAVLGDGIYQLAASEDGNTVLADTLSMTENRDSDAQKFHVQHLSDGSYTLTSLSTEKLLTVEQGNHLSGAAVQLASANGTENQNWLLLPQADGTYAVVSCQGGCTLGVNGADLRMELATGSASQHFRFVSTTHTHSGSTVLETVAPSCESEGYRVLLCEVCGEEYRDQAVSALGHDFEKTGVIAGTCLTLPYDIYTCTRCEASKQVYAGDGWSEWTETYPENESDVQSRTVYRHRDYQIFTSQDADISNADLISSEWIKCETKEMKYVEFPGGFDYSNSLYKTYSNDKVTASETETEKTTVDSENICGYIYWHWCFGCDLGGEYWREISPVYDPDTTCGQGTALTTFHAWENASGPEALGAVLYTPTSGAYAGCALCVFEDDRTLSTTHCGDTYLWFYLPIYQQTFTTYEKQYTYGRYTEWSDWSEQPVEEAEGRQIESRTEYRYVAERPIGSHAFSYRNDGASHTVLCTRCGSSYSENHTFVNGVCVCGAEETAPELQFYLTTVSLESKIILYTLAETSVLNGFDSYYVEFQNLDSTDERMSLYKLDAGSRFSSKLTVFCMPINVCQMTDRFSATLYGVKDGVTYRGQTVTTSVEEFVYGVIGTMDAKMQKMTANMLEYGAMMQINFGYRLDHLANDELGQYEELIVREVPAASGAYTSTNHGLTGVQLSARALSVGSAIQLQYAFCIQDSSMTIEDLYAEFEVEGKTFRFEGEDFVKAGSYCILVFEDLLPTEGDSDIQVTVYRKADGAAVSETFTDRMVYAVGAYQGVNNDNLYHAVNALLNYYRLAELAYRQS